VKLLATWKYSFPTIWGTNLNTNVMITSKVRRTAITMNLTH
jgi:hypothetical protein